MNSSKIKSGVYCIENTENGMIYIGGTTRRFKRRWAEHRRALNRGKHHNPYLQRDWTKNGPDAFRFSVLAKCYPEWCQCLEAIFIARHRVMDKNVGYNMLEHPGKPPQPNPRKLKGAPSPVELREKRERKIKNLIRLRRMPAHRKRASDNMKGVWEQRLKGYTKSQSERMRLIESIMSKRK